MKFCILALLALTAFASPLLGQGFILPEGNGVIRLQDYRADADIAENIAGIRTRHTFYNPGPGTAQGVFYFPIPAGAQVTDFSLIADGKEMRGELLEADAARKIYNDIVRKALDPALLEMLEGNTFRASVFPIPAGATREITVNFSTIMPQHDGLVKFTLPLRGTLRSETTLRQRPPRMIHEREGRRPASNGSAVTRAISLQIRSSIPINNVYSPSHDVEIDRERDRRVRITHESTKAGGGDFVLYYALEQDDVGLRLLTHRPRRDEDGYFALLISPRVEVDQTAISRKDVVLIVDVSGSMAGEKLKQARESLRYWVRNLDDRDRFTIVTFSTGTKTFQDRLVVARDSREDALAFIDRMKAVGGTNIHEALQTGLRLARSSESAQLVFLTDGLPTSGVTGETEILDVMKRERRSGTRVFTYGLGYDVNTRLLDGIAREGRALSDYVSPDENLEEVMGRFYDKIRYPVLTGLTLDFGGARVEDLYPSTLPDLYKGQQLVVFGRYRGPARPRLQLRGTSNGRQMRFSERVTFRQRSDENGYVAPLWAARKIGHLLEEIKLHGENPELKSSVIALSKEFGIVTPYTAYLAREDDVDAESVTENVAPMPRRSRRAQDSGSSVSLNMAAEPSTQGRVSAIQAASGKAAVQMSEAKNRLKKAEQLASFDEKADASTRRRVDGRLFALDANGYWVESGTDTTRIDLHVAFASDGYFALLQAEPGLASRLALGERLIVRWKGKTIRVDAKGRTTITAREIGRIFS